MVIANWGPHSSGSATAEPMPWLLISIHDYGGYAVQYFWMISGFIFAFVYGKSHIGFGEYCGRRFARLYPLHLVTLLVVMALQVLFVVLIGTTLFMPENDLYHFVLNLFFVPSLGLEQGPSFNWPIWSVAVEVPIYIFFWLTVRYMPMNTVTALIIAGLFFLSQDYITFTHVDYCGMLFFIGVAIFHASAWFDAKRLIALVMVLWIAGLAAVMLVPKISSINTVMLVIAFGPPLALLGAFDQIWAGRHGLLDRMAAFGDLSYSIYLLHLPVLMAFTLVMIVFEIERHVMFENMRGLLAYLAVTIWVSHLSLKWFENPARRWLRNVLKQAPAAVEEKPPGLRAS